MSSKCSNPGCLHPWYEHVQNYGCRALEPDRDSGRWTECGCGHWNAVTSPHTESQRIVQHPINHPDVVVLAPEVEA